MDASYTMDYAKFMDEFVPGEDMTLAEIRQTESFNELLELKGSHLNDDATRSAFVST